MKLQKAAHRVYKTPYHIVWVMRYRRKILGKGVAVYLQMRLQEVYWDGGGLELRIFRVNGRH